MANKDLVNRLQLFHVPAEEAPAEDLLKYSLHQLQNMVVDFGNTHKGKGQMVSPTLWQQQEGQPPSHLALLSAGDRKMRTGGQPSDQVPLTDGQSDLQLPVLPTTKAKAKAQAKMQARPPMEPRASSPAMESVLDV